MAPAEGNKVADIPLLSGQVAADIKLDIRICYRVA